MDKTVFVFNKFYASLIKDLKKQEVLKEEIKKHYKAIDKLSKEHIQFMLTEFDGKFVEPDVSKCILKNISMEMAIDNIKSEEDKEVFWNYYYILAVLALVANEFEIAEDKDDESLMILANAVLEILGKLQKGTDVTDDISVILQDDIQVLLPKIKHVAISASTSAPSTSEESGENAFAHLFKGMEDSKICNLAQEISKDIDISNLKIDSQEDIARLLDFSSSNNMLGEIVKKVSSSMQNKIASGELKQEDLFGEAISMMGKLNMGNGAGAGGDLGGLGALGGLGSLLNNPMISQMMGMAKKGKAKPNPEVFKSASSRDRLRKKLEERRKNEKS